MPEPTFPLSLRDLLHLIRYELHLTRDEMAEQCGLCPCCYAEAELVGDPELEPSLVASIHEHLPHLSTLLRAGKESDDGQPSFEARLTALELASPADRELTMARVRLELQWLDDAAE